MSVVGIGTDKPAEKRNTGKGTKNDALRWESPILENEIFEQRCTRHNCRFPVEVE